MIRRDEQTHELGGARRFSRRFTQLGDRVELTDGGVLVDLVERQAGGYQRRRAETAPRNRGIRRVPLLDIVDELGVCSADVVLRHEVSRAQGRRMVRVGRRKEFPDQGQRTRLASTRVRAARRIAGDRQCRAPLREVTRVLRVGGDLPPSDETNPVGMNAPAKPLRSGPQRRSAPESTVRTAASRKC